ncbi:tail fiber protein [Sinomicrobium kalidii]|uniref:tail fiber protein n=1 Tax=Sinomicrobium kalidii TaxID=2900738 RepID=UPI001E2FC338|nr:tail fiber protein [Sinomicrobium kalidii]UGU17923.1 tail fiber protein [Sinomicrobium kalidii]
MKKKYLLLILLSGYFGFSQNQFPTAKGTNVKLDGGYIEMIRPQKTGGWARGFIYRHDNNVENTYAGIGILGSGEIPKYLYMGHGRYAYSNGKGLYILPDGNTGLGITSPESKLDIYARGDGVSLLKLNTDRPWEFMQVGTEAATSLALRATAGLKYFRIQSPGGVDNASFRVSDTPTDNRIFLLTKGGRLGIGTVSPDAELTVKGKIHTREVKVDLNGAVAPDYVFKEGYDLRSLEEVQAHIKEKGHLPGIPSAKEMEEEGINLKEMNLKLLEKVEELTLYIMEQDKEIKKLKEGNTRMREIEQKLDKFLKKI